MASLSSRPNPRNLIPAVNRELLMGVPSPRHERAGNTPIGSGLELGYQVLGGGSGGLAGVFAADVGEAFGAVLP